MKLCCPVDILSLKSTHSSTVPEIQSDIQAFLFATWLSNITLQPGHFEKPNNPVVEPARCGFRSTSAAKFWPGSVIAGARRRHLNGETVSGMLLHVGLAGLMDG